MERQNKLEAEIIGQGVVVVTLTRDHVRPETLPGTRQFLIEAISAKGGYNTLIVDVSNLTYEDMVHGLQYRNGLTTRSDISGMQIHNPTAGDTLTLAVELRNLHNILQLQAKTLIVAGINETTRKMLHKAKIDRQFTLKDTVEEAAGEMQAAMTGHWSGAAGTVNA